MLICSECQRPGIDYRVIWARKNDLVLHTGASNACRACAAAIINGPNTVVVQLNSFDWVTDLYQKPRWLAS